MIEKEQYDGITTYMSKCDLAVDTSIAKAIASKGSAPAGAQGVADVDFGEDSEVDDLNFTGAASDNSDSEVYACF